MLGDDKELGWRRDPTDTRRDPHDLGKKGRLINDALVSVVVPCYNQAHFLGEAIESVLAQSYSHLEILVVDDGSTDNTSEVAARYSGVRCIRQYNQGLSTARNSGIRESKGAYLVFLDADDRLLPSAIETNLECLEAHPECAFVSGRYRNITVEGTPFPELPSPYCVRSDHYIELLRGNYIEMHATVMYRRSVFGSVGGFDTSLKACEDYDICLRIARDFPVHCHGKIVAEYRRHATNMSRDYALMLKASLATLRSQRIYISRRDKRYEEAYKAGMRGFRRAYGVLLAREVLAHVQKREWKRAMRQLLVLLRYYPLVLVDTYQKLRSSTRI
jgi:glycosyltransferase involved in cell wall biosynthesis